MVAQALLATFVSRLGEQWTAEMQADWTEAYETIVGLMSESDTASAALASS